MKDKKLKIRPVFVCSTCGLHSCTLIVDRCEDKPTNCPYHPEGEKHFSDWFEMEITEVVATNEN